MVDFDAAWERVQEVTGWRSYTRVAAFLEIKDQSVHGAKNRGVMPLDWVFKIAQGHGVLVEWLATGTGPKRLGEECDRVGESPVLYANADELDREYVLVPRYNVQASAGGGSLVESEQVVDFLAFKSWWVRTTMHMNPADLVLISAMGDSMYPTIREGDLLLVDKSQRDVKDDAIYVMRLNDALVAKRLQKLYDGSIQIKSDNKQYDAQLVPHDRVGMLTIIGRVVWIGGRV